MKVRYTLDEHGQLIDRAGHSLGRLVSLTLEADEDLKGAMGVKGSGDETQLSQGQNQSQNHGAKTIASEATELGQAIADVWSYWCEQRKPSRTTLEPAQGRLIAKGLRANFSVEELGQAIDGLLASEWHREHKRLQLSALFATRPGGPTLRDQIEGWIERAPSQSAVGAVAGAADVRAGIANDLKNTVMRGWHHDKSKPAPTRDARERAAVAADALTGYGVEVSYDANGRPVFS